MNKLMDRKGIALVVAGVVVLAVFFVMKGKGDDKDNVPAGVVYYHGVMKSKSGDTWGTGDGKAAPPPEGYRKGGNNQKMGTVGELE